MFIVEIWEMCPHWCCMLGVIELQCCINGGNKVAVTWWQESKFLPFLMVLIMRATMTSMYFTLGIGVSCIVSSIIGNPAGASSNCTENKNKKTSSLLFQQSNTSSPETAQLKMMLILQLMHLLQGDYVPSNKAQVIRLRKPFDLIGRYHGHGTNVFSVPL